MINRACRTPKSVEKIPNIAALALGAVAGGALQMVICTCDAFSVNADDKAIVTGQTLGTVACEALGMVSCA
jgi:hypothetical protein